MRSRSKLSRHQLPLFFFLVEMKWASVIISVFILLIVLECQATTFTVGARTTDCFYETVSKGTELGMVFQVLEGGVRDITVEVIIFI